MSVLHFYLPGSGESVCCGVSSGGFAADPDVAHMRWTAVVSWRHGPSIRHVLYRDNDHAVDDKESMYPELLSMMANRPLHTHDDELRRVGPSQSATAGSRKLNPFDIRYRIPQAPSTRGNACRVLGVCVGALDLFGHKVSVKGSRQYIRPPDAEPRPPYLCIASI